MNYKGDFLRCNVQYIHVANKTSKHIIAFLRVERKSCKMVSACTVCNGGMNHYVYTQENRKNCVWSETFTLVIYVHLEQCSDYVTANHFGTEYTQQRNIHHVHGSDFLTEDLPYYNSVKRADTASHLQ